MEGMVDRVIQAILSEMSEPYVPGAEAYAIAAIKAMREPTPKMEDAGCSIVSPFGDHNPGGAWRAMIDAAIEEYEAEETTDDETDGLIRKTKPFFRDPASQREHETWRAVGAWNAHSGTRRP